MSEVAVRRRDNHVALFVNPERHGPQEAHRTTLSNGGNGRGVELDVHLTIGAGLMESSEQVRSVSHVVILDQTADAPQPHNTGAAG